MLPSLVFGNTRSSRNWLTRIEAGTGKRAASNEFRRGPIAGGASPSPQGEPGGPIQSSEEGCDVMRLALASPRGGIAATAMDCSSGKPSSPREGDTLLTNSALYREYLEEREEILKHKWLESEKQGHDIGFEKALLDWILHHRAAWREKRRDE